MTNEQSLTYEELQRRLADAEATLQALRKGQVDTIAGEHGTLVVRLAESQAREEHIKKVLLAIRNVNQLIVSEDDPLQLIERACVNLTETMGYLNAWIALLDEGSRTATATACSGFGGGFTALSYRLEAGAYTDCMKRALDRNGIVVVKDPKAECMDCPLSSEYGGRSGLSHSLRHGGKTYGILSVSVPAAYAIDEEEQALFDELAGDLAFALHKIEVAKHLRKIRGMLSRTERIANIGSWEWDIADDLVRWSEGLFRIFQRAPADGAPSFAEQSELYVPGDMQLLRQAVEHCVKSGTPYELELRGMRKDGAIRHFMACGQAEYDSEGQIHGLAGSLQDITERKNLEERSALLGRMLDEAPASITIHDTDGRFLFANRQTLRLHGYEKEAEFLAINLHDLDIPESEAMLAERFRRIAETGEDRFESGHYRKDGSIFPVEIIAKKIEWNGRPVILSIATDITERKRAEEALRESEAKSQLLLKHSSDLIWNLTLDGVFTYASPSWSRVTGYDPEVIRGSNFTEHVHPDDIPACQKYLADICTLKKVASPPDYRVRHADGSWHWHEATGTPVSGQKDEIASVVGVSRDITARKQSDESKTEEQTFSKVMIDSIPGTFYMLDAEGYYVRWNAYQRDEIVGKPEDRMTGVKAIDTIHPDDREIVGSKIENILRSGSSEVVAGRVLLRGGPEFRWLLMTGRAIIIKGKPFLIGIGIDISNQIKAEKEKAKLEVQLQQAQKMESVGRLAGGVAHDFNNMLGVILGHAEMAMEQVDPTQSLYADLQQIRNAAERSSDLTHQLLAFARKQTIAPKVLDLNETVEGMLKMLRRLIGEDIDLLWKPGRNIRPVKVDPSQIDQLLANLCVNARDAIEGVGRVTIETEAATFDEAYCSDHAGFVPGEYVLLAVSDDGCGMDNETLAHLFEPFFTTKELGKGTGLGLATVYGMVKQNSGFINVYSEPGQGTTFKVYLPGHAAMAASLTERAPTQSTARGSETILLVEDESAILNMTALMLKRLGYTVLPANTPGEAIRLAGAYPGHIDLLMTDVVMPEMNGRDLAGHLLSIYPDLKRLFMSGYTANVIAHHGVLDEGVHFIQKPFSSQNLGAKLRETLDTEGL